MLANLRLNRQRKQHCFLLAVDGPGQGCIKRWVFAFKKVPPKYKIHNGASRILQRRLVQRELPKNFDLDHKQGFSIPVSNLRNVVQPVLFDNNVDCVFPSFFLERCINGLTNGSSRAAENYTCFFALSILGLFMNKQNCLLICS
jgi:hypothetical protein